MIFACTTPRDHEPFHHPALLSGTQLSMITHTHTPCALPSSITFIPGKAPTLLHVATLIATRSAHTERSTMSRDSRLATEGRNCRGHVLGMDGMYLGLHAFACGPRKLRRACSAWFRSGRLLFSASLLDQRVGGGVKRKRSGGRFCLRAAHSRDIPEVFRKKGLEVG